MQKIMFNDKYGLTDAVLRGNKTMTRRIITNQSLLYSLDEMEYMRSGVLSEEDLKGNSMRINDVVAVAQAYQNIPVDCLPHGVFSMEAYAEQKGWSNKMFVEAKLMPHQIRITDITVERLQDISDEDCLKEGVYYDKEMEGYRVKNLSITTNTQGIRQFYWNTPRGCFAALIDKVSGKGTWEKNPWVFAYEFELIR